MHRTTSESRFEFAVLAGQRARQLLQGAQPREVGAKAITIAKSEVLSRKVEKVEESA